ncbi:MAG: ClpXP protease specificity-enhancing factor [Gammaproteobacteria bacterium]|nr:ClpXP protease specificity-enhancing factor [Gammaproteobacteria bacterium]
MTTTKPYFLRAVYEWIIDNNCTPHALVDTSLGSCTVPQQFVKDGVIVLNISPSAVRDFSITSEYVSFGARFSGVAQEVFVPVRCVRALYAKENGQGLAFDDSPELGATTPPETPVSPTPEVATQRSDGTRRPKSPQLTIVK